MRLLILIILSLLVFANVKGQVSSQLMDSIKGLNETEQVTFILKKYITENNNDFFKTGIKIISNSKNNYDYEKSFFYAQKGFTFYDIEIDSVNYYLNKVDLNSEPKDKIDLELLFNRAKGLSEMFNLNYPTAIQFFHKNIELSKNHGSLKQLQQSYADAALPHYYSDNLNDAITYWIKSLHLSEMEKDYNTAYGTSLNIALSYAQQQMVDSAKSYKQRCLEIGNYEGVSLMQSTLYLNSGVIEYQNNDFEEAINMFKKSTQYCIKEGEQNIYAKAISNISSCYLKLGQPEKSKEYFKEALQIVKEAKEQNFVYSLYKQLAQAHKETGHFETAYLYLDSAFVLKDSILNESKIKQLTELQKKYESVEKDKKIIETQMAYNLEKKAVENQRLETDIQRKQKFYLYFGLGLVSLFGLFILNRYRLTQKQKKIIEKQKLEVESQKSKIETQHKQLEETHHEISDSIKYAQQLQQAILPPREDLKKNLGKGFVLFLPKDVVSGDFYWAQKIQNKVFFAAADCTGHGVPGAMVSVVCSNALNRSVKEFKLNEPFEILNKTREIVIETFERGGKEVKDGMDIALCAIENNVLSYSGANNPLWIVRKTNLLTEQQINDASTIYGEKYSLIEHKANRMPVGLYSEMSSFTQLTISLQKEDSIYIFTDGFADQFGGDKGKKLKYKPFKQFLLNLAEEDMDNQRLILQNEFNSWKGDFDQIDDVCIIGVRI